MTGCPVCRGPLTGKTRSNEIIITTIITITVINITVINITVINIIIIVIVVVIIVITSRHNLQAELQQWRALPSRSTKCETELQILQCRTDNISNHRRLKYTNCNKTHRVVFKNKLTATRNLRC